MDVKIFDSLSTYWMIYLYLTSGSMPRDDVCKYLKENGKGVTTAKEHTKKAAEGVLPFITCQDDKLVLDMSGVTEFIKELALTFQFEAILEPKRKKKKQPEDGYTALTNSHSPAYIKQMHEANSAKNRVQELEDEITRKNEEIEKLKKQYSDKVDDAVLESMDAKVIVIGSAKVKPPERFQRDFFLADPGKLLNVEELVSKYGGEINSPYEPVFLAEKELTTSNYLQRIGQQLFKGKFLKARLEEQDRLPIVNNPKDSDVTWVKRDSINKVEIEKNRLESVNAILAMDGISNQIKLSLYAAWFEGVDPEMVELLNYAGEQDINANYLIRLLEKPKEYRNYRTIRGLLQQAKKASEAHIKREAALELICGEWYVEAEYKGKPCRFQMMPVNEMQAFMELLQKHQTEKALTVLNQMLIEKRKADFEHGDIDGQILVTGESEENKAENVQKKDVQIEPPDFLHEKEKDSGVNCHPKINEDDAYEGFSEPEQKGGSNGKE
ncbi:MAG: hypothetical protein PHX08_06970 [Lachnospiraceae bacterium]|nr:hypothetical protein [Lachnospiraceae bacterium]